MNRGEVLVILLYFAVSLASIALTRNSAGSSLLWPANAVTAALLVRMPSVRWGRIFVATLLAAALVNVWGSRDALLGSLVIASIDVLEVVVTAYLFKSVLRLPVPNITFGAGLLMFALLGIGIPVAVSLPGGAAVSLAFHQSLWPAVANWFTAVSSGAVFCAPPIYLYSRKAARRLLTPEVRAGNLALAAGCLVVTYLAIRFSSFPLITLGIPLIIAAFRMGAFGSALLCELVGLFVVVLWAAGIRPAGTIIPLSETGVLAGLPFAALGAIMLSPMLIGLAAEERERAMRALRFNEQRLRRSLGDLAEERERLRTTLRAIGDAVITTDAVGLITYINTAAESLIGQGFTEVAGRRLDDVVVLTHPRTLKTTRSMFALSLARGEPVTRPDRCLLHRPDGTPCYVIDTASPVHDAEGAVSGVVVVLHDATAAVARDRELKHRAAHDPLTGLTNRFEFERQLGECFERYRHIQRLATLLLIDLDRFKEVNDNGGHAAGDEVLRRVAQTLTAVVQDYDTISRPGGDEFAILLSHSDPSRAELVGARVLRAIAELTVTWDGREYRVGASIGAARLGPGIGTVAEWLAAADRACYEAKRAGRGQMRVAA